MDGAMLACHLSFQARGPVGRRWIDGGGVMVIAALKTLTWGTVVTAVVSALLLGWAGGSIPRIASITGDVVRGRLAAPAQPVAASQRAAPPSDASHSSAAHARAAQH
jgi:hypothetical protein